MLKVKIYNVSHGDCILLEKITDGISHFGIIDCNFADNNHKLYDELISRNVRKLSFVILTHPHLDHYKGMLKILTSFEVDNFITFPLRKEKVKFINNTIRAYAKLIETSAPQAQRDSLEFVKILDFAKNNLFDKWQTYEGPENIIRVDGFDDVEIRNLLPLPKNKEHFFQIIDKPEITRLESDCINEISLAILLKYKGNNIVLSGDATGKGILEHRKNRKFKNFIQGDIVKLPHHGSKDDCTETSLKYLFKDATENTVAIISAKGSKHHPAEETLKELDDLGIKPYCTNLSKTCGQISRMITYNELNDYSPEMTRFLNSSSETSTSCQGDITAIIDDTGLLQILTENNTACPYRDNFGLPLMNNASI